MNKIALGLLAGLLFCAPAWAGKTKNVILVIPDGVRWQEVFTGADPLLLGEKGGNWEEESDLKKKFWHDDHVERRRKLFPFLWNTVAKQGQIFGNQNLGSIARTKNKLWFSYPGYNEMSTGIVDTRIDSNEYGPNPNVSVFEWLNTRPGLAGKVEAFATWDAFHDIFNGARSKLPIRAGATLVDANDRSPRGLLLRELYDKTTRLEHVDPYDSFVHVVVREHLKTKTPRVLFLGYGDTDIFQHMGRYDAFLEAARNFDGFMAELWAQVQSTPFYKDQTTLIISTDHGRGSGPEEWKDHGSGQAGSGNIWLAVIGPDTPPLGERKNVPDIAQAQIAATLAAFVGENLQSAAPQAAPPIREVLGSP